MLTVSLHGICLYAPYGLYPQEQLLLNEFEIDVDVWLPHDDVDPWPFVDYTRINDTVRKVFDVPASLLENLVQHIHIELRSQFPAAEKIKITLRKYHPAMNGEVQYAQVCYEA